MIIYIVMENESPACGFLTRRDAQDFVDERRERSETAKYEITSLPVYGEMNLNGTPPARI